MYSIRTACSSTRLTCVRAYTVLNLHWCAHVPSQYVRIKQGEKEPRFRSKMAQMCKRPIRIGNVYTLTLIIVRMHT